ncbi:aspartate dehydrogenase [Schaedlerella sp.]|uniref:aspartate dehydrogenase n=1 Tax=Schaedlerella sp. TaxID=2676057 RepID=UPI0013643A98|nr:aspartate dehydrogenase [Lachnospiraceae bacterium]
MLNMFRKKQLVKKEYDRANQKPVLRCSICTGEQVAGFKNIHTGQWEEVMLIKNEEDLETFKRMYDLKEVAKEY